MCVYIYYVNINTHTYSIYIENIYVYLHSADPRLLGALRKTVCVCVWGGGGGVRDGCGDVGMKEWLKRTCPCFTPSRIALKESARETVSLLRLGTLSKFTLYDLADFYVESVTAHHIKRNDHSCFHNRWPN